LSTYKSVINEVIDAEVEQYVDSIDFNNTNCVQNNNNNSVNDSVTCEVITNDSNIDCNTYDNKGYTKTTSNIDNNEGFEFESDPEFDEWVSKLNDKQLEVIVKQNVSSKKSYDFDDSFECITAETLIIGIDGTVDRIETKPIDNLDDDGFESDDSFELVISKLTNKQLLGQQNCKTDSRGH
jgi:hypothetical protein